MRKGVATNEYIEFFLGTDDQSARVTDEAIRENRCIEITKNHLSRREESMFNPSVDLRDRISQRRKKGAVVDDNLPLVELPEIPSLTTEPLEIFPQTNQGPTVLEDEDDELVNIVDDVDQGNEDSHNQESGLLPEDNNDKIAFIHDIAELAECEYCSELFPSVHERDQHLETECPNLPQVENNLQTKETDKSEQRSICDNEGNLHSEISTLTFSGKRKSRFTCMECGSVFQNRGNLVRHKMIHKRDKGEYTPATIECKYCRKRYANEKTLSRHEKMVHGLFGSVGSQSNTINSANPGHEISRFKYCRTQGLLNTPKGRENKRPKNSHNDSIDVNGLLEDLEGPDDFEDKKCKRRLKTTGELLAARISDAELSIYVDQETKQCLICFGRYMTKYQVLNHIRKAHANNIQAIDAKIEPHEVPNILTQKDLIEQFPSEATNLIPQSSALDDGINQNQDDENPNSDSENLVSKLQCAICLKTFDFQSEYDRHMLLPHKIEIKNV